MKTGLKVAIAGSSGFVGAALSRFLEVNNIEVIRLVRGQFRSSMDDKKTRGELTRLEQNENLVSWNPDLGSIDIDAMDRLEPDAVVNLAGENVHQRWNTRSKKRMTESRLLSTELLAKTINQMTKKPRVFISASGISYYLDYYGKHLGTNDNRTMVQESPPFLDESAPAGSGFLSELCQKWEDAAVSVETSCTRLVKLRIGIALGRTGGMLAELLPLFKYGLGLRWGTGSQLMSWIAIDDLVRMIHFAIINEKISGPLNAVSNGAVTNAQFTTTLGKVLSRPAWFSVPKPVAHLLFGKEWADSTLLADYRIKPKVALAHGFNFLYPELEPALIHLAKTGI
jgi:uncharacterized protein (TIGR01777 family)